MAVNYPNVPAFLPAVQMRLRVIIRYVVLVGVHLDDVDEGEFLDLAFGRIVLFSELVGQTFFGVVKQLLVDN